MAKLVRIEKAGGGMALGRVGGKLITDTDGAPCCCNPGDWREAVSCNDPENVIYVPTASTCTGSGDGVGGKVIVYGPGCWSVSNSTIADKDLPPDAVTVTDTEYECVANCADDACGGAAECCRSAYRALIVPGVNGADISNTPLVILGSEPGWRERVTMTFMATRQFPGYFDSMQIDLDVEILLQGRLPGSFSNCIANVVRATAGGATFSAQPNNDTPFSGALSINTDRIDESNGFGFTDGGAALQLWELCANSNPNSTLVWLEPNPPSAQPIGYNLAWGNSSPGRMGRTLQLNTFFPYYVPYSASGPDADHRDGPFDKYMQNNPTIPGSTGAPEYRNLHIFSYSSLGRTAGGGLGSTSSTVRVSNTQNYNTSSPNFMVRQNASASFSASPLSASMSMLVDTERVEPLLSGGEVVETLYLEATNTGELILNGPCNPNLGRGFPNLPPHIDPETMLPYTQPGKCYGCGQ